MKFGTVRGMLLPTVDGLTITILLETAGETRVVRDDRVSPELIELAESEQWLVDQLVQEALGNDLADDGWEVIAVSSDSADEDGIVSPTYTVRMV